MSQKVPDTAPISPSARDIPDIDSDPEPQSIYEHTTQIERKKGPTGTAADLLSILPSEIISVIFCHACKPIHGNRKWQRDCHPLHLGQISRQYRQYAWATSELWTTIVIRLVPRKVAAQTELLEEWLGRTMSRPIDIYFEVERPSSNVTRWEILMLLGKPRNNAQPSIYPMINLLARHSIQWRCIEFHIPNAWYPIFTPLTGSNSIVAPANNSEATEPAPTEAPLDLPLLRSASLHQDDKVAIRDPQAVGLDLTLAPSLRALSLSCLQMSPVILERVDFKQITNLTFSSVQDINPYFLLPQLPNLEEAAFHQATFSKTRRFPKVRHKKLRRLELETDALKQLQYFLPVVILPRLESLSVCVPTTMHYSNVFTVPHWEADLKSLSLTCKISVEYDLIEVLSSLVSLRELCIRDCSTEATPEAGLSSIFFAMLDPTADPPYLPCLEVLSYEGQLAIQAIDFIEPLIIRSRIRGESSGTYLPDLERIAVLRKVKIRADQVSEVAEFSIAEYPDSQYIWEIMRMMEEGVLELITMDGEFWQ